MRSTSDSVDEYDADVQARYFTEQVWSDTKRRTYDLKHCDPDRMLKQRKHVIPLEKQLLTKIPLFYDLHARSVQEAPDGHTPSQWDRACPHVLAHT
jgi:hypothetical protein